MVISVLSGGNILLDRTGLVLKIADFGAAARLWDHHKFHQLAGTPPFMAPEAARAKGYDAKCDVWSMGCVVIEMATTRPPWVQENCPISRFAILFQVRWEGVWPCP